MRHPDDDAQAVDHKTIDILIEAAAPERAGEWRELREHYKVTFHLIADRKGVTLRARGRRVEFDNKTMTWIWLLGFAGWSAFRLHGPHFWLRELTGATVDGQLRASDPTYRDAEADLGALRYAVRDFPALVAFEDDGFWPDNIPRPQINKNGFEIEQQAAFDLIMIALAYMLLHEVRHVMYYVERDRPAAPDEELACDAFARAFLLGRAEDHINSSGELADDVVAKRQAGIALGAYALYEFTQDGGRGGTALYPPVAVRLDALFCEVGLPSGHWFWDFAASLLVAIIVDRDQAATVPELAGKELCHALINTLRERHRM